MQEARLRRAMAADADVIAAIWLAGWRESHLDHVPEALVAARTPTSFRTRAAQRIDDTTVAVTADAIAGFVMVVGAEVEQVYVDGANRGSGVAALLLDEAQRVIAAAGHRMAWLAVIASNTRVGSTSGAAGPTKACLTIPRRRKAARSCCPATATCERCESRAQKPPCPPNFGNIADHRPRSGSPS